MKNSVGKNVATLAQLGTSLAAIAAVGAIMTPATALAQTADSILRGKAQAGAEVVATEVNTGSVRRTTANSDGTYVLAGLQPGSYHVTAGDRSADLIIPVASTLVQDFIAPPAQADNGAAPSGGDIVVKGTRPTAEVRTSQVNQFVTLHDIAAIPQVSRNFLEFADTVPGVQFEQGTNGKTSLRGGAQLSSGVNVYIDGVSQKDYVGGGSGITGSAGPDGKGDPGNPFPQLAIAEYKVVTSNYSAQYGDASSAIILAQTKSGTNQFHGEGFFEYTDEHLRAKYPAEKITGSGKGHAPSKQYGVALGGPIIKDIAHFFFTWEHKSLSNQNSVFPASGVTQAQAEALLPADIASQYGPVTNPFNENLYFGKIDLEPSSRDRIEATGKFRIEHSVVGGGGQSAASTRAPYANNDRRGDIRWQHSEDNWLNEARVSYQNTKSTTTTTDASPQFQYIYYPNPANSVGSTTLIITGGPGSGVGTISRQSGFTFKDDFTLPNVSFAGDHTFRAGFSYGSIKLTTQDVSSDLANATYYYAVTSAGVAATPNKLQFPSVTPGFTTTKVTTRAKQYSAYIQDDWNVDSHLTLNLGLRWDHEVVPVYLNYVTPANVVSAINGLFPGTNETYASVLAKGYGSMRGFNINDYISTGNNRKAPNNFSPRLGFAYDVYGDNKHVIFGGYARAYNRNQFATQALETTKLIANGNPEIYFPSAQTQDAFGPCATQADVNPVNHCYTFDPAYLTPQGLATLPVDATSHEVDLLHNNLKTPYSDQFSLGMRNAIGDWNTQVTLSYVASYEGIVGRLGNRYANGAYFQNGIPWGAQGVPGVGGLILFDNGAKDRLLQLGVGAQKAYTRESHWSASIAYTLSFADQNNIAGGTNPYQTNNNKYLFDLPYAYNYPFLRATAVPTHRLVATYTRDLFWGITAASKVELATPNYATNIVGCPPNQTVCNAYGGSSLFVSKRPHNFFGYKDVDVQISKDVNFWRGLEGYVRVDLLNIFNFRNYDSDSVSFPNGPGGFATPTSRPVYNKQGTMIGVPFTVKLSGGLRF